MKLLRRHKAVLFTLGVYWPAIFWLTHIPVPAVARQSGMSDKEMHILAYFVLTFLVWFAVNPYQKTQWNRAKSWVVLVGVLGYAAIDEYLQGYVGRSADMQDFIADIFGIILALGLLSLIDFWPAMLVSSAIYIFVICNFSKLLSLRVYWGVAFYFTAFAAFTVIWIQYLDRMGHLTKKRAVGFAKSLAVPAFLLVAVKLNALMLGGSIDGANLIIGLMGVCVGVMMSAVIFKVPFGKEKTSL
jgi:hypothetical protein